MLIGPVDRKCAAVHKHDHDRFSARNQVFQQVFLRARQVEAGSITAGKTFDADRHLLAFEFSCEAKHSHD